MAPALDHVAALFDFHTHSKYSPDGSGDLHDFAKVALAKGLQGFAVTDHNTLRIARDIRKFRHPQLLVVPGMEVSTAVGHCLAIGVQAEVPRGRSLVETLEAIRDVGGVGIPSHPFRLIHGAKARQLEGAQRSLTAIEVYNARDGNSRSNERAAAHATTHRLGGTGGSDAHQIFELGNAYTMFPDLPESVDDVVRMLRRKVTWGAGAATPRAQLMRQNLKNAWLFATRGFRSI